jgi:regulator of PEP synthase PpsR (kinase-PPPase family)
MSDKLTKPTIVLLSGSTGRTCAEVFRAGLAQFDSPDVKIVHKTNVRSVAEATDAVVQAAESKAVILHSIVDPEVREAFLEQSKALNVPSVDVLGPVLTLLEDHLGQSPHGQPGLSYQHRREHFDRIDAVSYTLTHDDGCRIQGLPEADVVIVGVSRASKSVTCFYLAYRGVRAANVPLIPDCEPPQELLTIDPRKVIGLTMNANRLARVREVRIGMMGRGPFQQYGDTREIERELNFANALMARHGWRKIDVSYMSVEEVAKEVMSMLEK